MTGPQPTEAAALIGWWIQGIAYAIAIDVSMFVLSDSIRSNKTRSAVQVGRFRVQFSWYVVTFAVVVLLSAYFQLVYGYLHTQALPLNTGVSEYWLNTLSPLLDARIVIVPLALPLIAVLYALGGMNKGVQKNVQAPKPGTPPPVRITRPSEQPENVPVLPQNTAPSSKVSAVQRVQEHLDQHPEDRMLSVRKLAQKLNLSPTSVHVALKAYQASKEVKP